MSTPHASCGNKKSLIIKSQSDFNSSDGFYGEINPIHKKLKLKSKNHDEVPHISTLFITKKNICGADDRKYADVDHVPFRMVCNIIIETQDRVRYRASGFFISPRCVITAGHCVFQNDAWVKKIEVIPADRSGTKPFGSSFSDTFFAVDGWVKDRSSDYDYAAIILDDDNLFSAINGYFGYTQYQNGDADLYNSGYPHDEDSIQKYCSGKGVSAPNENLIKYIIDTYSGNSGSPVYIETNGKFVVVGVHTYGACANHAVKVRDEVISNWNNWSKIL